MTLVSPDYLTKDKLGMLRSLLRDKVLVKLFAVSLVIKLLSINEAWVERYYSTGIYRHLTGFLRLITGWVPFSVGDLVYAGAFVYLVVKTWKYLKILKSRTVKDYLFHVLVSKLLRLVLSIYLVFNIAWGLNYNRQGIAAQLHLDVQPYSLEDLEMVNKVLVQRLNRAAATVDTGMRKPLERNVNLFKEALATYKIVEQHHPFLKYRHLSVKTSFFSRVGHYFGFTGYYNPFTGEAQIKSTAPVFIKPFVVTHEMAHQLGYAKESEANLVAFLSCRRSKHPEFVYSIYYDMFYYSIRELHRRDSLSAKSLTENLHPQVKKDNEALAAYFKQLANPVEPYVAAFYDEFLKLNNQPKGVKTYNEVVAFLIAYQKRYGLQAI
jgi:hypothetical protein